MFCFPTGQSKVEKKRGLLLKLRGAWKRRWALISTNVVVLWNENEASFNYQYLLFNKGLIYVVVHSEYGLLIKCGLKSGSVERSIDH
jgi:hypothetical protein